MSPTSTVSKAMLFILTSIRAIINLGTDKVKPEDRNSVRILNKLALETGLMVYGIGSLFYHLVHSKPLIYGVILEGSVLLSLLLINRAGKPKLAAFLMLALHCFSAIYFGALLGMAISTELVGFFLIVFLVLGSFFIFRNYKILALNLAITATLIIVIEYNNYHRIIVPIDLDHYNLFVFRWFSIAGMLVLTLTVSWDFVAKFKELLNRLTENDKNRRIYLEETSHELKSPLNTILTQISFVKTELEKFGLSDEQIKNITKSIDSIIDTTNHGIKVVNNVQEASKIEAGKPSNMVKTSFKVKDFFEKLHQSFMLTAENKSQKVVINFTRNVVPSRITTDETMLRQILVNLITNALKYGPFNSLVTITVNYSDRNFIVNVHNEGRAIIHSEVFDSHVSTDYTVGGGTGLGLRISRHLAERLGGGINLSCGIDDTGVNFTLFIPVQINERLSPNESKFVVYNEKISLLRNKKVLVIDDDSFTHICMKLLFRESEYYCTSSGMEGVKKAIEVLPDLILLDSVMGGELGGLETLIRLKSDPNTKQIPVVIITGSTFKETENAYMDAGADYFLPKPIVAKDLQEFCKTVENKSV